MDLRGIMETDAFQWEDHHGTGRLIRRHPTGNGLLHKNRTWRLQNHSTRVQQETLASNGHQGQCMISSQEPKCVYTP